MQKFKIVYKCTECGGKNLHVQRWVDMNTHEVLGETENDAIWCEDCEEHFDRVEMEMVPLTEEKRTTNG